MIEVMQAMLVASAVMFLALALGLARSNGVTEGDPTIDPAQPVHVCRGGPAHRRPRGREHFPHVHGRLPKHRRPDRQRGLTICRHARQQEERNPGRLPERAR